MWMCKTSSLFEIHETKKGEKKLFLEQDNRNKKFNHWIDQNTKGWIKNGW